MKTKRFLGGFIVKTCPWGNHEFETDSKQKTYCSELHQKLDKQKRRRARIYSEREITVSDKPGASYRLNLREYVEEAPAVRTPATTPKPVVEFYRKLPVRAMSNFQSISGVNLPALDDGTCSHGYLSDCPHCWLS